MNNLYFIAVLPDMVIRNEVMDFKIIAKEKFKSSKALNSPAHITIVPPFKSTYEKEKEIIHSLNNLLNNTKEFYITLNGFNRFDKNVIFVDVEKNEDLFHVKEKVVDLIKVIVPEIENMTTKFRPHITVAFRDLKKEMFDEAWDYFSKIDYFRIFKFDNITLLRHNGEKWKIV